MASNTYAISITFTAGAKNDDKAQQLAERIIGYVQQEDMASEGVVVDIELLESADDHVDEDDFDESYD